MTNRTVVFLAAVALALVAAGCTQEASKTNGSAGPAAQRTARVQSVIAAGLVLSVEIPSTTLVAGSVATATVSIRNDGTEPRNISDWGPGIWIADGKGGVILSPRRRRHPILFVPLEPNQARSEVATFSVPPPGFYALQADWQVDFPVVNDGRTPALRFASVNP